MATMSSRARHASGARSNSAQLTRRWLRQGKLWMLPLWLSDYGRELIEHKYDAFATDRAYENQPAGRLGPIGKLVDWIVLQQDIHVGLRQRLALVVDETATGVREQWAGGVSTVRLVSGPCGLARDLRLTWQALGSPVGRLGLLGLDLDAAGDVLPTATQVAAAAGVPLEAARCDLLDHAALAHAVGARPADIFLSIGLAVWLDAADLVDFLSGLRDVIAPGGLLVVDNFRASTSSLFARDLEMAPHYHADAAFERALERANFAVEAVRETRNHVNVVYRCRRGA